jgi:hypothetical protein
MLLPVTVRPENGAATSSSSDGARGFRSDSNVLCTHPNIIERGRNILPTTLFMEKAMIN